MAGMRYEINRTNVALSTTVSTVTLVSGALRHFRVVGIVCVGLGTASLAQEMLVSRVNAAGVGATTAITPRPVNPAFPAAVLTAVYGYATSDPTLLSDLKRCPFNGNGGVFIWNCKADFSDALEVPPGANAAGSVTFRSSLGTGNYTLEVIVEEL